MTDGFLEFPREIENNPHSDQLEQLVCQAAAGELMRISEFPLKIEAGDIETYTNWLSDLTVQHPKHYEFGAVPHLQTKSGRMIYPSNPASGKDGVGWAVSRSREINVPTVSIHSHPNNWPFSHRGDLGTIFAGFGKDADFFCP